MPPLEPLSPACFLRETELPSSSGPQSSIFVLGTFEKRLVVLSQQRRAVNLIEALGETGRLPKNGETMAVVGGGVAGLTAAVAAANKGVKVVLFERERDLLSLFMGCGNRYLHPNLYDWPAPHCFEPSADVPWLRWEAGLANAVARGMLDTFNSEASAKGIDVRTNARVTGITGESPELLVEWSRDGVTKTEPCSVVVLAVGFGLERDLDHEALRGDVKSYWRDDDHGSSQVLGNSRPSTRYLISGVGDGGLTDTLRVRLKGFDQRSIIELFLPHSEHKIEALQQQLQSKEEEFSTLPQGEQERQWTQFLDNLEAPELDRRLKKYLRGDTQVALLCRSKTWVSLGSFLLNRLLVSRLFNLSDGGVERRYGRLEAHRIRRVGDEYAVPLGGGEERFHRIILRHGREHAFSGFKDSQRNEWSRHFLSRPPTRQDATHVPFRSTQLAPQHSFRDSRELRQRVSRARGHLELAETLLQFISSEPEHEPDAGRIRDFTALERFASDYFKGRTDSRDLHDISRLLDMNQAKSCGPVLTARALVNGLDFARGEKLLSLFRFPLKVEEGRLLPILSRRTLPGEHRRAGSPRWFQLAPSRLPRPVTLHDITHEMSGIDIRYAHAALPSPDATSHGPEPLLEPLDPRAHQARLAKVLAQADLQGARVLLFPRAAVMQSQLPIIEDWWQRTREARFLVAAGHSSNDGAHRCTLYVGSLRHELVLSSANAAMHIYIVRSSPPTSLVVLSTDDLAVIGHQLLTGLGVNLLLVPHFGSTKYFERQISLLARQGIMTLVATTPPCQGDSYGLSHRLNAVRHIYIYPPPPTVSRFP